MPAAPTAVAKPHGSGDLSIPLVVVSAIISGLGIFGVAYWLITFNWLYFLSVVPFAGGCYLLFTRATGADHA